MLEPSYMYIQAQHIPYIHSTSQDKEAAKKTAKQQACKHILYPYSTTVTTASGPITSLHVRHTRLCFAIYTLKLPHSMLDPSQIPQWIRLPQPRSEATPKSKFKHRHKHRYIYIPLSRVINILLAQPHSALAPDSPRPYNRPILSETGIKSLDINAREMNA
ncbi:uncharacterized protein EAF01_004981 [Botrytis porri]|uniref:uncharacterized protein n=1 Tax=Botrytis porri TaxID=87229 RepID=UPI0018FF4281|nr:uncharacterized protein EAF01_004981 [Botrytis porri]KAF7907395.1 hypothetical protein EAF01_004981 [Botrytis porri]